MLDTLDILNYYTLLDFLVYVHDKQRMSCQDGETDKLNDTKGVLGLKEIAKEEFCMLGEHIPE